jgi:altronate hydrolase
VASRASGWDVPVGRFGLFVGFASRDIAPGDPVHTHNCALHVFARE